MSAEENRAIYHQYLEEVWNKGNINAVDAFVASDFHNHMIVPGATVDHRAAMKMVVAAYRTTFPDYHVTVEAMVADEAMVACHLRFQGTQHGVYYDRELGPIEPTGQEVTVRESHIVRFREHKMVEKWMVLEYDSLAQLAMKAKGLSTDPPHEGYPPSY